MPRRKTVTRVSKDNQHRSPDVYRVNNRTDNGVEVDRLVQSSSDFDSDQIVYGLAANCYDCIASRES